MSWVTCLYKNCKYISKGKCCLRQEIVVSPKGCSQYEKFDPKEEIDLTIGRIQ